MHPKLSASALIGVLIGYGSTFTLFTHSWTALVGWGIAGAIVGSFASTRKLALWMGGLYGAGLSITFLLGAFGGTPDKIPTYLLLVLVFTPIGAVGGLVSSYVGYAIHSSISAK